LASASDDGAAISTMAKRFAAVIIRIILIAPKGSESSRKYTPKSPFDDQIDSLEFHGGIA
jgi:hypothetical protein